MNACHTSLTLSEKLAVFRACFAGLAHVYGTRDLRTQRISQVKHPVTDRVIVDHLCGRHHLGTYLLNGARTRAVVIDFDTADLMPAIEFQQAAQHYGLPTSVERSKSKGHHVWLFFVKGGVPAAKARLVARHVLDEIGLGRTEVFPKQDRLESPASYGNFIFAPLCGALVREGRTVFLRPDDLTRPAPRQWELLRQVERITEARLDEIIAVNDLGERYVPERVVVAPDGEPPRTFGLPACAQRMLAEGVQQDQRVSCFRLAVALKRTGLPFDSALDVLHAWAGRNRPVDGKRTITPPEIEAQTRDAYRGRYRSYGCEEAALRRFCDPACPVHASSNVVRDQPVALNATVSPDPVMRRIAMSTTTTHRPVRTFRAGKLSLAVWENASPPDDRAITRRSVTVNKRYHDEKTNAWKDSSVFFPHELPQLRLLLDQAYAYLMLTQPDDAGAESERGAGDPVDV
jgi:hypothetical protein